MTDSIDDLITLQFSINQIIYDAISIGYNTATDGADPTTSIGMIVSAISTNLGVVLAQIPETHRDEYINMSKVIFEKSLKASIKAFDESRWGQIGHA